MFEKFCFRVSISRKRTNVHKTVEIVNPKQISIGSNCIVESQSFLKGGDTDYAKLIICNGVMIKRGAYISASCSEIQIKDHSYIGHNVWIGGKGKITVGMNSMVSIKSIIISSNHDFEKITIPYFDGQEVAEEIIIGNNVWIGSRCVILPGVTIGDGSVIGAGSVVTKSVTMDTLVVGNPASAIRHIKRNM